MLKSLKRSETPSKKKQVDQTEDVYGAWCVKLIFFFRTTKKLPIFFFCFQVWENPACTQTAY